jgi:hypothetical protein
MDADTRETPEDETLDYLLRLEKQAQLRRIRRQETDEAQREGDGE